MVLTEVPEYREDFLRSSLDWYMRNGSPDRVYTIEEMARIYDECFFVNEDGVVYDHTYDDRLFHCPVRDWTSARKKIQLFGGHYTDENAPIVCVCGCDKFQVFYPSAYETYARCVECGREHEVASG